MSLLGGILSVAGAGLGFLGSKKAASAQENAAESAAGVQRYMYDQSREDQAPYREAGGAAINQMRDLMNLGEPGAQEAAVNQFRQDPGYQFRVNEGQRALERSAAARGGLFSGNTGRELVGFGQGMADQQYGDYWNRLAGLSGTGQTATNQLGVLGANAGRGIGAANIAAGQARGSGYIGMADSLGSGLSGIGQAMGYGNQGGGYPGFGSNWGPTTNYNPTTYANPNANPIYTPWGGR